MNAQSEAISLPKAPENQNSDVIVTHQDSLKIDLQRQNNDEQTSNQQMPINDESNPNIQISKVNESPLTEEKTNNNLDINSFLNNPILKDNVKFENQELVNSKDCMMTEEGHINIGGTEENKDKKELESKNLEGLESINGIKDCTIKRLLNNSIFKLQRKKLKKERKIQEQNKKIEELLKLRNADNYEQNENNDMSALEKLNNFINSENNKNGEINNERDLRVNFAQSQQQYYDDNYKYNNQNDQDLVIDLDEQNSQNDYDIKRSQNFTSYYNNNNYPMESYSERNSYNRINNNYIDYNNYSNYNREEGRGNRYIKNNKIDNIQNMSNRLNELISLFKNFKKETEEEEKENQRQYGRNINTGFYQSNDNNNNDYLSNDISNYFLEEVKKKYKGKDKYKLLGIKNTYNKGKNMASFNTQMPTSFNQNNPYKVNQLQLKISNLVEKYSYQIVFDSLMKYFFPKNISNNYNYNTDVINQIKQLVKDLGFGHVLSFVIKIGNSRGEVVRISKYKKSNLMDINEEEGADEYGINNIDLNDEENNKNEYDIIIDEENKKNDKNILA